MKRGLALAMIGLASPAAAAPGPFTYNCKAPFWNETGLWQMNAGPLRRASGQVVIEELDDIPAEEPPNRELRAVGPVQDQRGAGVTLTSERESTYVAVSARPHQRSSDTLDIWISWQIGDRVDGRIMTTVPRRTDRLTRIPFALRNEGHRVIVEAAGVRAEAPVTLGPDIEFRASCQGGDFMFYELDWG